MLLSVTCMLLLVQVMVPDVTSQRPVYGRPWPDYFTQPPTAGSSNTTAAPSTTTSRTNSSNPVTQAPALGVDLGERIKPDPVNITFRFYDNVPIQGPENPCIGCMYRLTNNGFIRV